ncbi:MAG: hypothetical protein ACUVWN_11875 [bacterium]
MVFSLVILSRIGKGMLAFFIAESMTIALFSIGNVCDALTSSKGRKDLIDISLTRLDIRNIILAKLIGANIYNFIFVFSSAIITLCFPIFRKGMGFWEIAYANMITLLILITSIAISSFFSVVSRNNVFFTALISYFIIFLLLGSILLPVPFIERTQNQKLKDIMTKVSFYANPIIMLTRSLGKIDIMRTEYMYDIADPIVGRGFSYPDWRIMAIIHASTSIVLLFLMVMLANRLNFIY